MSDLEDMDVDEFADQVADLVEDRIDVPEPDVPDVPDEIPGPDDIQEIAAETAGATVQDQLEHLVHEDCDTPACNDLRDQFGLNPSGDDETDESETESDESEAEGNDESSQSSETEGDSPQTGDGPESDSESGSDAPENVAFPDEY